VSQVWWLQPAYEEAAPWLTLEVGNRAPDGVQKLKANLKANLKNTFQQ